MENGNLDQLSKTTMGVLNRGEGVPELASLNNIDRERLTSFISGFDHLFSVYTNGSLSDIEISDQATHIKSLKKIVPALPTITELIDIQSEGGQANPEEWRFLRTIFEMKKMLQAGSSISQLNPDANVLDLDLDHPEALFYHQEKGASPEGLAFATVLHITEMNFNRRFKAMFKENDFIPQKDWLTDVSMELMILNEAQDPKKRDEDIHQLFDLVNNKLGWIKGYPHIHPALREIALLAPLKDRGISALRLNSKNFKPDDPVIKELVDFDNLCFEKNPTGSAEHTPPLLAEEDIISGIRDHNNNFVVLRKAEAITAVLQVCQRRAGDLHIMSLSVSPENRWQGYGNTLLDWVEAEAENLGTEVLTLRVDPDNIPAVSQYLKRGFAVVGVRQGIKDHPNVVTLAMTKNLKFPIVISGDPILISDADYGRIDSMTQEGYRGLATRSQDGKRLLEMIKPDETSAESYPYWK